MKFIVDNKIFEKLPNACFGAVVGKGIDNSKLYSEITALLDENIKAAGTAFEGRKVKEEPAILPYREAFKALNINPNKYMCSIEALFTRIAKGKGMPHINPVVDIGNAVSLKYTLPIGAHDIMKSNEDICVRFSNSGDEFIPFGGTEAEAPDEGEVVYAVGNQVRTRRWTWRQSERGKIDENSSFIFFPIDGFTDFNKDKVLAARDELESYIRDIFGCKTQTGFIDALNPQMDIII